MASANLPTPIDRLDAVLALSDAALVSGARRLGEELLQIGETALEGWVRSRGETPTREAAEGFRLLALHRQGARGEPSFNACRETCRELVYNRNCAVSADAPAEIARRLRLGAMVARHLVLFVDGKLETAGLGEFCCSSRPLRQRDAAGAATRL
jgi:hypothetical protein